MSLPAFSLFVEALRARLREPLPGQPAQLAMAPQHRMEPELLRVEGKRCREAAVLALLYPAGRTPTLVLTVRHGDLEEHAGQIALPGGARDVGEVLSTTALREAREEIGIHPEAVELLGKLTPLYIPPSGFCVYPFVATVTEEPDFLPAPYEVTELIALPVRALLNRDHRKRERRIVRGQEMIVPYFHVGCYEIWGATAMILSEFSTLVEEATGGLST